MSDLISRNRSKKYSYPRQIAMYLARKYTDLSFHDIGREFGKRDHTTVVYAIKLIERKKEKERRLRNQISKIEEILL